MNILAALKTEASKLDHQLDTLGYENPGRKEQRQSRQAWQEMAHVCKRESQNSEGAKSTVGEGESGEENCLMPPFVPVTRKKSASWTCSVRETAL